MQTKPCSTEYMNTTSGTDRSAADYTSGTDRSAADSTSGTDRSAADYTSGTDRSAANYTSGTERSAADYTSGVEAQQVRDDYVTDRHPESQPSDNHTASETEQPNDEATGTEPTATSTEGESQGDAEDRVRVQSPQTVNHLERDTQHNESALQSDNVTHADTFPNIPPRSNQSHRGRVCRWRECHCTSSSSDETNKDKNRPIRSKPRKRRTCPTVSTERCGYAASMSDNCESSGGNSSPSCICSGRHNFLVCNINSTIPEEESSVEGRSMRVSDGAQSTNTETGQESSLPGSQQPIGGEGQQPMAGGLIEIDVEGGAADQPARPPCWKTRMCKNIVIGIILVIIIIVVVGGARCILSAMKD